MSKVILTLLVFLYICKPGYAQKGVNSTAAQLNQTKSLDYIEVPSLLGVNNTLKSEISNQDEGIEKNRESQSNETESNISENEETKSADSDDTSSASDDEGQWFQENGAKLFQLLGSAVHVAPTLGRDVPIHPKLALGWHVGIYIRDGVSYRQICGGSLVTKDAAISAAHCFWDESGLMAAEQFAVNCARYSRKWRPGAPTNSNVSSIVIPPRFLGIKTSFQDDIAVVRLTHPQEYVRSVQPLCVDFNLALDKSQLRSGNLGTISGYGLTAENGKPADVLTYIRLPYVDITDCIASSEPSFLKYITSDKICAGDQNTGRALCRGDSGGGLVFFEGVSRMIYVPYLRGIASTAPRSKNKCNAFALGSFTHVYTHRNFLRENIPGLEDECSLVYAEELAEIAKNKRRTEETHTESEKSNVLGNQTDLSKPANVSVEALIAILNAAQSDITGLGNTTDKNLEKNEDLNDEVDDGDEVDNEYEEREEIKDKNDVTLSKFSPKLGNSSAPAHAWHVMFYFKAEMRYVLVCGGTLVKTDVVISAGNCFVNGSQLLSFKMFAIGAGKQYRFWGDPRDEFAQYSDIKRIQIPESFIKIDNVKQSCFQHDVAVVTLATPFKYTPGVKPACVDFEEEFDKQHLQIGSLGKFLGWGNIQDDCKPYPRLYSRDVPFVDQGCSADFTADIPSRNETCTALINQLNDGKVAPYDKVKATCQFDSGGGLTFLQGSETDGLPYLRGVATAALPTSKCGLHVVDSFTRLREEREFLQASVPGLEEECRIAYPVVAEETEDPPLPTEKPPIVETETMTSNAQVIKIPKDSSIRDDIKGEIHPLNENGVNEKFNDDLNREKPTPPYEKEDSKNDNKFNLTKLESGSVSSNKPEKSMILRPILSAISPQLTRRPGVNIQNTRHNTSYTQVALDNNRPETIHNNNKTDTAKAADIVLGSLPVPVLGNGSPAFEWHVGIYSKLWEPYMQICGGSLIKKDVVLSAANCFWSDDFGPQAAADFAVAAGKRLRPWTHVEDELAQFANVKEVIIPDRFVGVKTSFQDDIAIVRLTTPFKYSETVKPICVRFLDETQLRAGRPGMLAGWGLSEDNARPSQLLHQVQLPYLTARDCIRLAEPSLLKFMTSDKICAGDPGTVKYLCRSDTGGGLVFTEDKPYLRGIASAMPGLCNPVTIARFTHIASHASFLKQHVGDIEGECSVAWGEVGGKNVYVGGNVTEDSGMAGKNALINLFCNCNCNDNDTRNKYRP